MSMEPLTPLVPLDDADIQMTLDDCKEGVSNVFSIVDRIASRPGSVRHDMTRVRIDALRCPLVEKCFYQFELGNSSFESCALDALETLVADRNRLTLQLAELQRSIERLEERAEKIAGS